MNCGEGTIVLICLGEEEEKERCHRSLQNDTIMCFSFSEGSYFYCLCRGIDWREGKSEGNAGCSLRGLFTLGEGRGLGRGQVIIKMQGTNRLF